MTDTFEQSWKCSGCETWNLGRDEQCITCKRVSPHGIKLKSEAQVQPGSYIGGYCYVLDDCDPSCCHLQTNSAYTNINSVYQKRKDNKNADVS